jgi:fluoroacetyl-CoA thioesterase
MVDLTPLTGLIGTAQLKVGADHTAPFVGSGRIAVLATPVMINLIEAAALNAIERLLPTGHQSLGIHLDVSHIAATPAGFWVTATATVLRVEGRTITFQVQARDDVEVIGSGIHKRVVVSVVRFDERLQRKVRVRDDPAIAAMRDHPTQDLRRRRDAASASRSPGNSLCGREAARAA